MSKLGKCLAILITLLTISMVLMSATYAKYTSEYSGADTALIARWDIGAKAGNGVPVDIDGTPSSPTELKLFDHLFTQNMNEMNGEDYIIAPGVEGQFTVQFNYNSDVAANLQVNMEKIGNSLDIPIQYAVVDGGTFNWGTSNTNTTDFDELSKFIYAKMNRDSPSETEYTASDDKILFKEVVGANTEAKVIVRWRWPYAAIAPNTNALDTAAGEDSYNKSVADGKRAEYGIKVTVTGTQVAPAAP